MYPSYDMLVQRKRLIEDIVKKKRRVNDVAEILAVKRETVSRWVAKFRFSGMDGLCPKKPGPVEGSPAVNRTSDEVESLICTFAQKNPYKGPQRLSELLLEESNIDIDQSTVYRILKRTGIRYGLFYKKLKKKRQLYCLQEPGEEVQLDVHLPFGHARKDRLFDAIDDCSRFVHGKMFFGHTQQNAIAFVDDLICTVPFVIKAIRTDCGREFGKKFTEHLVQRGIEHRKNAPYTPQHNGKIERYHRTFKELEGYRWNFTASIEELNYHLYLWMTQYNFKRKHTGLGMNKLTPVQKVLYASLSNSLQPHSKNVTLSLQQNKY